MMKAVNWVRRNWKWALVVIVVLAILYVGYRWGVRRAAEATAGALAVTGAAATAARRAEGRTDAAIEGARERQKKRRDRLDDLKRRYP